MVLSSFEKIFVGYGAVVLAGAIAFFGARASIYKNRDSIITTRERIKDTSAYSDKAAQFYPHSTTEARDKFYKELAEKKATQSS